MMTRWGDRFGRLLPFKVRPDDAKPTWRPRPTPSQRAQESGTAKPSGPELDWLRRLARGDTVADVARSAGVSERTMFRRLRSLYKKMKVRDRAAALRLAKRRGWL
ncbi:response regulator transcription factor [Nonomuraea typhae]|uniref:response regulator transcription factor n=1 Tax=Nonomuraea typhae TaxID=2603600 RepID=UPI0012FB9B50|nr:LuxR C-terminal-related transcriptional regulator [Nonomuraea typhae]